MVKRGGGGWHGEGCWCGGEEAKAGAEEEVDVAEKRRLVQRRTPGTEEEAGAEEANGGGGGLARAQQRGFDASLCWFAGMIESRVLMG